jgi:hypothetical protein
MTDRILKLNSNNELVVKDPSTGDTRPVGSNEDIFSYNPGMVQWASGLSNEEIGRIELNDGEELVVERIEFEQKGGGSSTNASVSVYDMTASTELGSQTLGGVSKDVGRTGTGNTIIIRITQSTGSIINAEPIVSGYINEV